MSNNAYHGRVNPALDAQPVVPNDIAPSTVPNVPASAGDLPDGPGVLVISVGGTLTIDVVDKDGTRRTRALTVPAGVYPCRVYKVWATGTAATGISVLYE